MVALSRAVRRHHGLVIGAWIALVAFSVPFALSNGGRLSAGVTGVNGSQSQTVQNALDDGQFGAAGYPKIGVVVEPGANATPQDLDSAVNRINAAAQKTAHVELPSQTLAQAQQQAQAGKPFIVPVTVTETLAKSVDPTNDFINALDPGTPDEHVTTYVVGQSSLQAEQSDEATAGADAASSVSLPVILILLLATFGSIVAAIVPLALGFAAVSVTGMAIYFLSGSLTISIYATSLSAMIGLAVAVDYSLFILMRHREELRRGASQENALETAMRTSAVAVMFSGTTVIVSLAGLFLMPNETVRSMALAAIIVVAASLLGAATLLPALITAFGRRVETPGKVGRALSSATAGVRLKHGTTFWQRQTGRATRRPWLTIAGVLAILLIVASPLVRIDLNESTLLQLPGDNQARVGTALAGQISAPGSTGPTLVLVHFDSGTASDAQNQQALGQVKQLLSSQPSVAQVTGPQPSSNGRAALYSAALKYYAESDTAKSAVEDIRDQLADAPATSTAQISVGGLTASEIDFRNSIADSMWKIVLFILGVSFLILLVLLRSLVLPIVGVAMNVLCVGAAYGVQVAIFQWGWLPFLGFQDFAFVNSVILPLLLAIVFGLSMDYQVFLLTRIRGRWEGGVDTREAAREGTGVAGPTIAAAATIMIGVFLVFVIFGVPTIQAAGLGAAVAVAASAFLVQLAFMPALIVILGERVWWIPRSLDRLLPEFTPGEAGPPRRPTTTDDAASLRAP